jgi:putative NADPH-quinone reductase
MKRGRNIVIVDGHPDPDRKRFIHALADAYGKGAGAGGHGVRRIEIGTLDLRSLRSNAEFATGTPTDLIRKCQDDITWADHIVFLFPLWLGDMPGLLKLFLEQVARPGFAFSAAQGKGLPRKLLRGKSARIIVTMGMPALFYKWYYRAHSVKNMERNILNFCGIAPVRTTLVGMVEGMTQDKRVKLLQKIEALGTRAG